MSSVPLAPVPRLGHPPRPDGPFPFLKGDFSRGDNEMTDLEAYVGAKGRDKWVKDARVKIDELGISYIYYQFISVTGRIVGKGASADH